MIIIDEKTYLLYWEILDKRYDDYPFTRKSPEELKRKEMSDDEFFKELIKENKALTYSTYVWDEKSKHYESIKTQEFLPILFPANFVSVGNIPVYISSSGRVHTFTTECLGWYNWGLVVHTYKNWETYKGAVLGPYKNENYIM